MRLALVTSRSMPKPSTTSPMPESVLMSYAPPGTRTVTSPVPLSIETMRGAAVKFSTMSPVPLSMLTRRRRDAVGADVARGGLHRQRRGRGTATV